MIDILSVAGFASANAGLPLLSLSDKVLSPAKQNTVSSLKSWYVLEWVFSGFFRRLRRLTRQNSELDEDFAELDKNYLS